jgi:hypothetical protein
MKTPVVFFIFKRPDTTELVFDAIRQAKPSKLFVVADGPRSDRPGEAEKCTETRSIIERVDWNCEVIKNYSDVNLGCAKRVSSGLDWVFQQVEKAIILEDDCVPHPSFFSFCEELLDRYQNCGKINSISAQNFDKTTQRVANSYYFSRYPHCWGWATWRRAWQNFDFEMTEWQQMKTRRLIGDISLDCKQTKIWEKVFDKVFHGEIDSWAYRWLFCCWLNSTLSIHPSINLVENIGFSRNATHTSLKPSYYNQSEAGAIEFPLSHPSQVRQDLQADNYLQDHVYANWPLPQRIRAKLWKTRNRITDIIETIFQKYDHF